MRATWWLGVSLLLVAGLAFASQREEMRKQVEGSMLLTGTIDIEADGSVSGYAIDKRDKVPDYVLANIGRHVPGWRFEPVVVDGRAVPARTKMNLRLVARPAGEGDFLVFISGANFGEYSDEATDYVTRDSLRPPQYPSDVYSVGGRGDVYVLLKVGRDGKVADAFVEQVNLRVVGTQRQIERMRKSLADATLRTARSWTFRPPTTGDAVGDDAWVVRVPVAYTLDRKASDYGTWQGYVPGPRQRAPWAEDAAAGNDALVDGGIYPVGGGITLLTKLLQPEPEQG